MEPLFDVVRLKGGRTITGIVDHVTYRHVYIFDCSCDNNLLLVVLASLWKANAPHMRFSHYCLSTYPRIQLPNVKLLARSAVEETSRPLVVRDKPRAEKTILKLN